jgi:hypothetical protein
MPQNSPNQMHRKPLRSDEGYAKLLRSNRGH